MLRDRFVLPRRFAMSDEELEGVRKAFGGIVPHLAGRYLSVDQVRRVLADVRVKSLYATSFRSAPRARLMERLVLHSYDPPERLRSLLDLLPEEQRPDVEKVLARIPSQKELLELREEPFRATFADLASGWSDQNRMNRLERVLAGQALTALQMRAILQLWEPGQRDHALEVLSCHWSGRGSPELVTSLFPEESLAWVEGTLARPVSAAELRANGEPALRAYLDGAYDWASGVARPLGAGHYEQVSPPPRLDAIQLRTVLATVGTPEARMEVLQRLASRWTGSGDPAHVTTLLPVAARAQAERLLTGR